MAGHHKIFLGMAAGVGKTFRMLQEGRAEAADGRDVVLALLETHGRAETAAVAAGLERLPLREAHHRDTRLRELDLPGLLRRAPELALIDELAHTNVAGVEHPKRHEDVADVIAAGIDVLSTVNVQHLESLNDRVAELTGVRVRETVPDAVLAAADEIVLVDLTPQDLLERLRDGKVYPADRVPAALNGFFRVENLAALREVALRQVAEEVEAKRLVRDVDTLARREERLFGGVEPRPIAERLLALTRLHERDEAVVRRAWRSAQRLSAELDVLVVRAPGGTDGAAGAQARERLESLRRLASALAAHLIVEEDDDAARVAARVARERGTTYLLLAAPDPPRGLARLGEPLPMRLVRALPDVDVRIVAAR